LSQVEIDEVLRLVRHVAAEIAADDAMPCRIVLLVELLLDVRGNVLFDVEFLERLRSTIHSVLLHLLRHVGVLNNCFAVRHLSFN